MSVKACEGLLLMASIPNDNCAKHMLADTSFTEQITSKLSSLYSALPKVMDPADVESVDAKWGYVGHAVECVVLFNTSVAYGTMILLIW